MSNSATCPNCSYTLSVPPEASGRRVRCPKCGTAFTAPAGEVLSLDDPPEPQPLLLDPEPLSLDEEPARERRPTGPAPRPTSWKRIALIAGAVVLTIAAPATAFVLMRMRPPPVVPEEWWHAAEVPGYVRVRLPAEAPDGPLGPLAFGVKARVGPAGRQFACGVACCDCGAYPGRATEDAALRDFAGTLAGEITPDWRDPYEQAREEVALGPHRGLQFVMREPRSGERVVARCYRVDGPAGGRLIAVAASGRRLGPDHPNVQKLFASLEILPPKPGR